MMQNYGVYTLPRKYKSTQHEACEFIKQASQHTFQIHAEASDVVNIATAVNEAIDNGNGILEARNSLMRAGKIRICVTPTMDRLIKTGAVK